MSILIIDNYDSFTYNLYQLFAVIAASENVTVKRNDEIDLDSIKAMAPGAIVLSPGPGHPANDRDFGICKSIVKNAADMKSKILGVCLGHQGIVQHSGGNVIPAASPVHGKMSELRLIADSPLFNGIKSGTKVMRYHSLIAERESMPKQLEIVADESKDNLVMAVQNKAVKLYGLQFHPESIGTAEGKRMMENFLQLC